MRILRGDRAATDPILVIAAIAVSLVLLVGGSFAVAGMMASGKNLNARGDLEKVATAQSALVSSGKSLGNPVPIVKVAGTLPDPSGATSFNVPSVAVNYGGVSYAHMGFGSAGASWIIDTSGFVNGSWTPSRSVGSHTFDTGGRLTPSAITNPDVPVLFDLTGVTKAAGAGSITLSVTIPSAATGFAPYLSGGSGNLASDLSTGGSVPATALEKSDVGFTPSDGTRVAAFTDAAGTAWTAVAKSSTGALYIRSSTSSTVGELGGTPGTRTVPSSVALPAGITPASLNTALTNAGGF